MVKKLIKWYDNFFKSAEEIEHKKRVYFFNRFNTKTNETRPNLKKKNPKIKQYEQLFYRY